MNNKILFNSPDFKQPIPELEQYSTPPDIALEIIVNETAEKKYAYTPIEKYDKLIKKNPLLDTLRKELGLEL